MLGLCFLDVDQRPMLARRRIFSTFLFVRLTRILTPAVAFQQCTCSWRIPAVLFCRTVVVFRTGHDHSGTCSLAECRQPTSDHRKTTAHHDGAGLPAARKGFAFGTALVVMCLHSVQKRSCRGKRRPLFWRRSGQFGTSFALLPSRCFHGVGSGEHKAYRDCSYSQ
jgi:hypothetical protein